MGGASMVGSGLAVTRCTTGAGAFSFWGWVTRTDCGPFVRAERWASARSAPCSMRNLSRRRRMSEGSSTPSERMAVVGFSLGLAASKAAMAASWALSSSPLPFGRP